MSQAAVVMTENEEPRVMFKALIPMSLYTELLSDIDMMSVQEEINEPLAARDKWQALYKKAYQWLVSRGARGMITLNQAGRISQTKGNYAMRRHIIDAYLQEHPHERPKMGRPADARRRLLIAGDVVAKLKAGGRSGKGK